MSIRVICAQCQAELEVSDAAAGKKGRCPTCQAVMEIPRAAEQPAANDRSGATIRVHCQHCGVPLEVPGEMAGKLGRCPHCKSLTRIPRQGEHEETMVRPGTIVVTCEKCQTQLQVSAIRAGAKGRCPNCDSIMPIPALPPPADQAEVELAAPAHSSRPAAAQLERAAAVVEMPRSATRYVPAESARELAAPKREPAREAPPEPPQPKKVDEQALLELPASEAQRLAEEQAATPPRVETRKVQVKPPDAAPPPPKKKAPPQVVQPPLQPAPAVTAPAKAKAPPPVLTRPPPAKPPDPAPVKPPATPTPKPPATPTTKPPDKPSGKPPAAAASDRWRPAAAGATAAVSAHSPAASSHSSSPQTPQSRRQIAEQILAAFTAQIPRTPPSAMYKLGILLTTGMMLLLPLIYVGLIALAAGIVLWHLSANVGMLTAISGRGAILGVIAYVAPAVMGAVLVLFMIKPLFARSGEHEKSRTLSRQSDPLVFAFVEKVCATVQAPVPSQIDVNCEVNASAGFRSGLASFAGQDMVLTIGMPLVAGLSLQQFAGVLAHEFGHFSQGTGMRLTYVTRTINMWLMRVVYERDAWDMWLDNVTESVDIRIGWVLYLTRFLVWLTRRVLWLLMLLGHAVSGFMLREMEYDADRFEARLAGSQTFEATVRQLIYLNMAHQGAQADLENFYREGRLADNLPRLIIVNVAQLPDEARKYADEYIEKAETSVFDSHPADRDRIASARRENAAGVFASDLPATVLFEDFDAVAKAATWDLYSELFGAEFKPTAVRPIEEMLERQSREEQIYEAMKRYLLDSFQVLRPLRVSEWYLRPPTNSPDVQNRLAWARNEMQAHIAPYNEAWQQYDKADSRMIQMRQLAPLLARGCRIMADHFEHVPASATAAGYERDRAFADMNHLDARLAPLESAAGQRLQAALLLLHHPQFAARLADARELLEHCQRLMPLVGKINTHLSQIVELRNNHAILSALVGHIEDNEQNEGLFQEVVAQLERTHRQLGGLWDVFKSEAYPFDHQEGFMSISHFLLKEMPTPQELGGTLDGVDRVLASLASLYRRALARLCYIAERVETSLGWEPLPMPEKIVAP